MATLRLLLLLIISATTIFPAAAQTDPTPAPQPGFIATVVARDNPSVCDTVGWAFLPEEIQENSVNLTRQGACHDGVGAVMFGACAEPFKHSDGIVGPEAGQADVFCRIMVQIGEGSNVTVDPEDFYIVDDQGFRYPVNLEILDTMPGEHKLHMTEVPPGDAITGRLPFTTPDNLPSPFVLLWWPSIPPDQIPLGIIIDRTVPWSDVEQL